MINDTLDTLWKALSDPTRRHILDLLRQAPRTTGELSDIFAEEMSRYAVMKHLTVLEEASLITIRRKGRERYNHLNAVPLQEMYERWLRPYEAQWARSLINIKNQAEGANKMPTTTQDNISKHNQIEQEIHVDAPVEKAYEALLDINGWWLHRYSDMPNSLRLEATVGGRFWETRDGSDKNGILWGWVSSIEPNDHIVFSGNIGMQGAILGNVTLCTNPQEDGTTIVTLSHEFIGTVPEGYADGFVTGWQRSLQDLKKFIESK